MTGRGTAADGASAGASERVFADVVHQLVRRSHLVVGTGISAMLDEVTAPLGVGAEILVVDLAQHFLTPVRPDLVEPVAVDGTLAGRAFQHGELVDGVDGQGRRVLWVPVLDGTERVGCLLLTLDPGTPDDDVLRERAETIAGLMGHVVMSKLVYSDHLRRLRAGDGLSVAAELLWHLVPPRTFATEGVSVAALLEPHEQVAGDAYDYAVDGDTLYLGVFDGVGHDLDAGITTALAVTVIRNARRRGVSDLAALADAADEHLARRTGPTRFVTAVLARLDITTGALDYLVAGHPPPLLRDGRMIRPLAEPLRPPLGVIATVVPSPESRAAAAQDRLEPGDRILFYTDGVTEARDQDGAFFGEERLVDLTERTEQARLSAPEIGRAVHGPPRFRASP
ncbi:PP2C family protein-serine/threonine phosphatase [Actinomycetospora soli]|uniref:PP2C family protein-serine/threonine phosphatase n=1 Tax=Actinomycetospora soli TaxID=2893887 RepID=UPI001E5AC65B|nr:PP2C family protein-serine/threonine phosphatase [Actinomycetospora soli]MCD2190254.1 serine/threonine-protein phosphatase [Actinomycetospora soli]